MVLSEGDVQFLDPLAVAVTELAVLIAGGIALLVFVPCCAIAVISLPFSGIQMSALVFCFAARASSS